MEPTIEHFPPGVEAVYADLTAARSTRRRGAASTARVGALGRRPGVPQRDRAPRRRARHAVRGARHRRRWRRARRAPVETVARRLLRASRRSSASRGCATASARCPGDSHWQTLAKGVDARRSRRAAAHARRPMCSRRARPTSPRELVAAGRHAQPRTLERASRLLAELRAAPSPDLAMLSVALRELRNLA